MGFATIGSVGQYVKSMKMTMDWKQKKESGNYTKKSDEKVSEFDSYRRQLEEIRESAAEDKSSIYIKLRNGKKLTQEELEYLRDHNPELYKEAKEIEAEKKRYEEELKKCKTKEEVDALKTTYLSSKMAVAKEIASNPNIPEGAKMQLLLKENAKVKAIQEVDIEFKQTTEYGNLPTAQEKAEETQEKRAQLTGEEEQKETGAKEDAALEDTGVAQEIGWIDLRESAEMPKTDREYAHEVYRREMEIDIKAEPKEKNRGRY